MCRLHIKILLLFTILKAESNLQQSDSNMHPEVQVRWTAMQDIYRDHATLLCMSLLLRVMNSLKGHLLGRGACHDL